MSKILIVDDFYNNPEEVRAHALSKDFTSEGNYPGLRSEIELTPWFYNFKSHFEKLLNLKVTYWPEEYNSVYQYTTKGAKTWVHYDATQWACVVYLTPNPPIESGTAIYRHKDTGIFRDTPESSVDYNKISTVDDEWEKIAEVGNVFNRAVIYSGSYYHKSVLPGFGKCKVTGRLFQTFFFDAE